MTVGHNAGYFNFTDLAVSHSGTYRLQFDVTNPSGASSFRYNNNSESLTCYSTGCKLALYILVYLSKSSSSNIYTHQLLEHTITATMQLWHIYNYNPWLLLFYKYEFDLLTAIELK